MTGIAVVTDSTSDLPEEVREELGIDIIPLSVIWGEESLKDGVEIDSPTFYRRLQSSDLMPSTSQPSAGEFVDFYRTVAEKKGADTIVSIHLSSFLSGTLASAEMAKEMLPDLRIEVVNSLSTSMGLGFQAMAAAEAARDGASLDEVLEAAQRVRYRHHLLFLVDTLEFLHRGGRIGGAQRFLGTALRVKPLLELEGGKVEPLEQVRTKKKAMKRMLQIAAERAGNGPVPRLAIIHADALEEGWLLKEQATSLIKPGETYLSFISSALGVHVGPRALGVIFYTA